MALALDRPLLCLDLPGHGHSDWRDDHSYWPPHLADDVATVVRELAPSAELVVGMSLGGLTAICLAAQHPELVRRIVREELLHGERADSRRHEEEDLLHHGHHLGVRGSAGGPNRT